MGTNLDVDPSTPVVIGVGQFAERIDDTDYRGLSPIDLAVNAAHSALADCDVASAALMAIDTIAATRQFDNSTPRSPAPLGKSTAFPLSVANRLGARPRRAVLEVSGGQSPQHLINEYSREIVCGSAAVVLLVGAEAISTIRHLERADTQPDFSDDPDTAGVAFEDRGFGLKGLVSREQAAHGLIGAPGQYALLENARRAARKLSRDRYAMEMGELFAPFTDVAADNPYSAAPQRYSAEELVTVTDRNRMIADPYPRFLIARDQVNQGAAVLLTSVQRARELGVDSRKWVFLHGQADLHEPALMSRQNLAEAPSAVAAVRHALEVAGLTTDEIDFFDLYSCFPIAVSNITEALGLSPLDPRKLTLTGGLPFFGGAGNSYSMHAVAEAVEQVRSSPGSYALVAANGGVLSKTSVGVYSSTPTPLRPDQSSLIQAGIDGLEAPPRSTRPNGWATIETYTVVHNRNRKTGIVIGRLEADGARFIARVEPGDDGLMAVLDSGPEPIGERVYATSLGTWNCVSMSPKTTGCARRPSLRDDYQFAIVKRNGPVLEVTINRPDVRNCLHPPAHDELAEIFDAYFADSQLWVAIITGAGERAFCAGDDLVYTASGKPMHVPVSGFGGLTSRRDMHKPVIAAVNGFALGGGFEIALACHLVVAEKSAVFALSEVKVGLVAGAGGLVRLPRAVSPKIANELILTARRIDADEAHHLGVVNRVAGDGQALQTARELALEIISGSPTSVRLSLELMDKAQRITDTVEAVTVPNDIFDELLMSADAVEGMAAFAEKRPPQWKNR